MSPFLNKGAKWLINGIFKPKKNNIRYYEKGNVMNETWHGDHEQKTLIKCYVPEGNLDVTRKYDDRGKWLGDTGKSIIVHINGTSVGGFTNGEWTRVQISPNESILVPGWKFY